MQWSFLIPCNGPRIEKHEPKSTDQKARVPLFWAEILTEMAFCFFFQGDVHSERTGVE